LAYAILHKRIEAFLALPLNELALDKAKLKSELDKIGQII
jgi:arsenate reductase